jgi:hypothetical protein
VPERGEALLEDLLAVCHEEQARAREGLPKARVVDRRHDRLPRARGGHEQVAVVTELPGERDLFEQPLLKWLGAQLDGAELHTRLRGRQELEPGEELVLLVRHKVAAVPVALEDGNDLVDDVRVASTGHSHVPLEPADLRGVREIRRADVRRREAGAAVEQPRFGMQPRGARVIRDANLGAELMERVERARFRGARVRRGQHPQGPAPLAVTAERLEQWGDATPADEGHDQVDAVGGVDLGEELMADPRLARSVGEEDRVEQRDDRFGNALGGSVGLPADDGAQHASWLDGSVGPCPGICDQGIHLLDEPSGQCDADADALLVIDAGNGALDDAAEVEGDAVGGVGRSQAFFARLETSVEASELRRERLGDQDLIETASVICHGWR